MCKVWLLCLVLGGIAAVGVARLRRIAEHRRWQRGPEKVDLSAFREKLGERR